jgi:hypothetical protein
MRVWKALRKAFLYRPIINKARISKPCGHKQPRGFFQFPYRSAGGSIGALKIIEPEPRIF